MNYHSKDSKKYKLIKGDLDELRKPNTDVKSLGEGFLVAHKLISELSRHKKGVGLAAPQIGIHKNVFILKYPNEYRILMNPVLLTHSFETFKSEEGCLSLPGVIKTIDRWTYVRYSTLNIGEIQFGVDLYGEMQYNGGMTYAAIAQHEENHLRGRLISDF